MSNKIIDAVCKPYIEAQTEMKTEKEIRDRIMSNKPKVGDTLYCVEQLHPYMVNSTFECKITKMGKTICHTTCIKKDYDGSKFYLKDLKHTQWNDTRAFLTEKERDEYLEDCELQKKLHKMLSDYNCGKYTRKQLTDIANILNSK